MAVEDVLEELGVQGITDKGGSDEVWALCPKHLERVGKIDRKPSWSINRKTLDHHCFSCKYGGNLISLTVDLLDISQIHAAKWVRSKGLRVSTKDLDRQKLEIPAMEEALLAPYTDPPEDFCAKKNFSSATAAMLGVRWNSRRNSWICPVRDPWSHTLWGWQEKYTHIKGFKNYPVGVKKSLTLFGIDSVPVGEALVIVESPLDVVCLREAGFYAVSTWGAQLTEAQIRILIDITYNLVLMYDNDESGWKATKDAAEKLRRRPISFLFADYQHAPGCKDPGDMTKEQMYAVYHNAYKRIRTIKTGGLL